MLGWYFSLDFFIENINMGTMSKRNDIHAPSVINTEDYDFVAYGQIKIEDIGDCFFMQQERAAFVAHMARTGAKFSGHEHGGNCHVCGAHCVYEAIFFHVPTNTYIKTGLDCAEKMWSLDSSAFRRNVKNARENQAGKKKALAILQDAGHGKAFEIYAECMADAVELKNEESTVAEMVGNLVRYGNISDKALNYIGILLERIEKRPEIEAQRAAEHAAAKEIPATDKRMSITGEVLSVKDVETDFGIVTKILVRHEDGWKVYGNAPSSAYNLERGHKVTFMGRVQVSNDDTKFGFFKRPTKFVNHTIIEDCNEAEPCTEIA